MYRGHSCAHLKHINLILCVPCYHTTYASFRNNNLLRVVICLTICWNVNHTYWIFIHTYLYIEFCVLYTSLPFLCHCLFSQLDPILRFLLAPPPPTRAFYFSQTLISYLSLNVFQSFWLLAGLVNDGWARMTWSLSGGSEESVSCDLHSGWVPAGALISHVDQVITLSLQSGA